MIRVGVIGAGWRAEFYRRIAALVPQQFQLTGIYIRNPETRRRFMEHSDVRVCASLDMLLETGCDFVVSCVSRNHICNTIIDLADRGIPVLTETPAGANEEQIARLSRAIRPDWRVQVAEQFHLQPHHVARKAVIDSGLIGDVHHVQLSVCHGYHAVSLIRYYLGTGNQNPEIVRIQLPEKSLRYNARQGILSAPEEITTPQSISILRFGDRSAVYDFTSEQYFSAIRGQRIVIRGVKGEILNDVCTYLDGVTPMRFSLTREECGSRGNLDGLYLRAITGDGRILYRSPFPGARLSDEETAIASCLCGMSAYLNGGESFYSLEDGLIDASISLQL